MGFDQESDSAGIGWGLGDWVAGCLLDRSAVCHCFLADATDGPEVCCPRCMS